MKEKKHLLLIGLALILLLALGCGQEQQSPAAPDVVSDLTQSVTSRFNLPDAIASSDVIVSDVQYDLNKIAASVFFDPSSVPTAGKVSPAFGPVVHIWTTEYDAFGVHFSTGPPGPNTPTAIFDDFPLAWGGVNGAGIVDLLAPVDGMIVMPGTGGKAGQTSSLTVEAGFAGLGNLLLEVWDCNGNLIGSTINDDGIGPNGRRLMSLAFPIGPGIAAFRVSTPVGDTYGVDSILMDDPTPCAPGDRPLFGTDASGGNLLKINVSTGIGTVVGAMGAGVVPALALDPTTDGVIYAGQGGGAPNLYTVDPVTGAATFVGGTRHAFAAIGGMDFRQDGTLYAAVNIVGDGGTGSDHLAIIDKTTGVATVIGSFGDCSGGGSCTIEGIEGIAFAPNGTLWGSLSARGAAGQPGLYRINIDTGAASFFAPIQDDFGTPPSGGVVSLQFIGPKLFGGTARAMSPATDGGRLIVINPVTGRFTFVGPVSVTGGSSLGGLAH